MNNWRNISYLENGSESQRKAFKIITEHNLLERLSKYDPAFVSTICVNIDIEGSDLDIICQNTDPLEFANSIKKMFSHFNDFKHWERNMKYNEVVASFFINNSEIEIYSSSVPTSQQYAYRHLSVMAKLLEFGGNRLRNDIKQLKSIGYKTEPAFAKILNLQGDPYQALLELEGYRESQIKTLLGDYV